MSIVERAADMLGAVVPRSQHQPVAGEGPETLAPGLIERAVSNDNQRADFRADKNCGDGEVVAPEPVRATRRVSRTSNIDLGKLRQQSFITPDAERTPVAESFRRIKRHILANITNPAAAPYANLVMISSPLPNEGKTYCAINLAISIAMEVDRTVLLVDADVSRPSVMAALGIELDTERGLMDLLVQHKVEVADVMRKTNIGKLSLLPAGTRHAHATEALASEAMRALLQEMAGRYADRVIIFDSPPLLSTSEASALASRMGQILVIVEAGKTTETALKDAISRIESSNVVGVILNKGAAQGSGYGGYGYGYGYGDSA